MFALHEDEANDNVEYAVRDATRYLHTKGAHVFEEIVICSISDLLLLCLSLDVRVSDCSAVTRML
jgi:hypothetical protein